MVFFPHSRASNSDVNSLIWPEFKLVRDFMAVLVICKFEDDPPDNNFSIISLWENSSLLKDE